MSVVTEFADDGILKIFDCPGVADIEVFSEEVTEEVQETDVE